MRVAEFVRRCATVPDGVVRTTPLTNTPTILCGRVAARRLSTRAAQRREFVGSDNHCAADIFVVRCRLLLYRSSRDNVWNRQLRYSESASLAPAGVWLAYLFCLVRRSTPVARAEPSTRPLIRATQNDDDDGARPTDCMTSHLDHLSLTPCVGQYANRRWYMSPLCME